MPTPPDPIIDPDRWAANLLRRLERHRLDLDAWRDLCREYGLVTGDDDEAVLVAWAALLLEVHPARFAGRTKTPAPTRAMPGTRAKIAAMAARRRAGQSLWHADDQSILSERLALLMGRARHNGRSQVTGVVEEGPSGPQQAAWASGFE